MATKKKAESGVVLVTGATGFLGKHLIEALRQDEPNRALRALVRQPTLHLSKHDVEVVQGDVCNPEDCKQAMDGVTEVYHLAGQVSRDPDQSGQLFRLHVEGTRNVLNAAAFAKANRAVVVSTSGTIAVSKDEGEISNESSPYRTDVVMRWPYYLSKIYQEQTALQLGRELGLDVVVVNPSLLLGPGDERGSSTGDIEKVVRGKLPFIPRGGGVAFVDARDAAAGCLLAMKKGKSGERYLLSAANMTLSTFLGRAARIAGHAAPRAIVSPKTMRFGAGLVEAICRKAGVEPLLDAQSIEMAEHTWYCDSTKAESELGWTCRDPQDTLLDTVRDVQRRHSLT
ncbi:MAG: NAD-dependent epimerase/dehydratase family protein [Myxococcota bacterium]|nr:NAD-dependent epimerase/dehydratase family protein [Myxococcota bacterium]